MSRNEDLPMENHPKPVLEEYARRSKRLKNNYSKPCSFHNKSSRVIEYNGFCGETGMELFSVQITDITGPVRVYGTIRVTETMEQLIFDVAKENAQLILPGQSLLMSGPTSKPLLADWNFLIEVDLRNADDDTVISQGTLEWILDDRRYKLIPHSWEVPLTHKIPGSMGSATLVYGAFLRTLVVIVDVTLLAGVLPDAIAATNNIGDFPDYETVLFRRTSDTKLGDENRIPLSKTVFSVPRCCDLIIRAYPAYEDPHGNTIPVSSLHLHLPSENSGQAEGEINGDFGSIKVMITWKRW